MKSQRPKILICGISSMLGTALSNELLLEGYAVSGWCRLASKYKGLISSDLQLIEGNAKDIPAETLQQSDILVQVAAETNMGLCKQESYDKVNLQLTQSLYHLANQHRIKKFIFISSANTIGHGSPHEAGDESCSIQSPFDASFYAGSKAKAEKFLLDQEGETEIIILNPGFILGTSEKRGSSTDIIRNNMDRRIIPCPPGSKSFVHIADVVEAIKACFYESLHKERILITGETMSYIEFFRLLRKLTGKKQSILSLPAFIMRLLGFHGNLMHLFGVPSALHKTNMKILCTRVYYNNQKSKEKLSLQYRSAEEAIRDVLKELKQKNDSEIKHSWSVNGVD